MAALDKLNKIPSVFKILALVIVVVGVVGSFHFMSWSPIKEEMRQLEARKRQLQSTFREQESIAANLPVFQRNTQDLERDLESALQQLPRQTEIETLLRDIYTLGMRSGLQFKVFQPGAEQRRALYAELPITLEIEGKYHDIAVFFDRIGKLSRIVNISNVSARRMGGGSDDSDVRLNVKCVATTFRFVGGT